ncbi:MAG: NADP-dependent oxidoreductase, partial [Alphaproteobacteria bacterium]|nr:NADP-dependent oxidoreductase [Alphaproteobacteria bacterium]
MTTNRQWIYARKPEGQVGPEHFELREDRVGEPGEGEVLV